MVLVEQNLWCSLSFRAAAADAGFLALVEGLKVIFLLGFFCDAQRKLIN